MDPLNEVVRIRKVTDVVKHRQVEGCIDSPRLLGCAIGELGDDIPVISRVDDTYGLQPPRHAQNRH